MGDGPNVSYTEALAELKTILEELEHDDIDVDRLAQRVARAAELIETCRQRIAAARVEVERIVLAVEDEGEAAPENSA